MTRISGNSHTPSPEGPRGTKGVSRNVLFASEKLSQETVKRGALTENFDTVTRSVSLTNEELKITKGKGPAATDVVKAARRFFKNAPYLSLVAPVLPRGTTAYVNPHKSSAA